MQEKLQLLNSNIFFSSWFLGPSVAFSGLQWPSVKIGGSAEFYQHPGGYIVQIRTDRYSQLQSSQVLASFSSTSVTCRGWGAWGWLVLQYSPASGCLDLLKFAEVFCKKLQQLIELVTYVTCYFFERTAALKLSDLTEALQARRSWLAPRLSS